MKYNIRWNPLFIWNEFFFRKTDKKENLKIWDVKSFLRQENPDRSSFSSHRELDPRL